MLIEEGLLEGCASEFSHLCVFVGVGLSTCSTEEFGVEEEGVVPESVYLYDVA